MANLSSNLQTILDNRLRYLPEITGQAINSIDWAARIITIGHTYGLHVDEMEEFQEVVLKSMIGLIDPEHFESELINTLALSPATTEKIISELNIQVFAPIHDFVMNGGATTDPIKNLGISIEPSTDSMDTRMIPTLRGEHPEFEIPASPEPTPTPAEKFEDYF